MVNYEPAGYEPQLYDFDHENQLLAWNRFPPTPGLPLDKAQKQGLIELPTGAKVWHAIFGIPLETSLKEHKPPLLFLHGGLGHSGHSGYQVGHFMDKYTVIVVDERGHGRSPCEGEAFWGRDNPDKMLTYDMLSDDVVHLLDAYNILKAAFVGIFGEGSVLTYNILSRYPHRVDRAFCFGPIFDVNKTESNRVTILPHCVEFFQRGEKEWKELHPGADWNAFFDPYIKLWLTEPVWEESTFHNLPIRGVKKAAPIVWVVSADHDDLIPEIHPKTLFKWVKNSSWMQLPGAGHLAYIHTPELYNKAVEMWLEDRQDDLIPTKPQLKDFSKES